MKGSKNMQNYPSGLSTRATSVTEKFSMPERDRKMIFNYREETRDDGDECDDCLLRSEMLA
jgi:hypothetical protein